MPISGFGVDDDRLISKFEIPGAGKVFRAFKPNKLAEGVHGPVAPNLGQRAAATNIGSKVSGKLKPVGLAPGVAGPAAPNLGQRAAASLSPRARKAAILGGTAAAGFGAGAALNKSAFGVEDDRISKAKGDDKPSSGRQAAGALFPGWHGAVAGQRGTKLRAAGNELGGYTGGAIVGSTAGRLIARKNPVVGAAIGSYTGAYGGAVAGTHRAHRRGYYKPER